MVQSLHEYSACPDRFDELANAPRPTYIIAIEDESKEKLIACGTVDIRESMFRDNKKYGMLMNLAVDNAYRGTQLGKL